MVVVVEASLISSPSLHPVSGCAHPSILAKIPPPFLAHEALLQDDGRRTGVQSNLVSMRKYFGDLFVEAKGYSGYVGIFVDDRCVDGSCVVSVVLALEHKLRTRATLLGCDSLGHKAAV